MTGLCRDLAGMIFRVISDKGFTAYSARDRFDLKGSFPVNR
jgi:hypothetical protein